MNIKKEMEAYKNTIRPMIHEKEYMKVVQQSKTSFIRSESRRQLSYTEFLKMQLKFIEKKWWVMQTMLLIVLSILLTFEESTNYIIRELGIVSTLFIVFVIPEFWKNREFNSMEIEDTTFFSLKEIYASRLILFGVVDVVLISLYCLISSYTFNLSLVFLMVHFIFPLCITAIICLLTLSNTRHFGQSIAIFVCIVWSGIWFSIVSNSDIYQMLTLPIWCLLVVLAIISIGILSYKVISSSVNYWEDEGNGVKV